MDVTYFEDAAGEHNLKTVLPQLHQRGYVAKFGDRYKKTPAVGPIDALCYCLLLQTVPVTVPKRKSSLTRGLSNPDLLVDDEDPSHDSDEDN